MNQMQWKMKTQIADLYLVASEHGLRGVFWKQQAVPFAKNLKGTEARLRILAQTVKELNEYLSGDRKKFNVPLDVVEGTVFQKKVWEQLALIPYGKTVSYQEIAQKLNKPKACRAVGSANGKNPVSIIVPCHRVIAADGKLGGFAGGLDTKSKLLALENSL